MCQHWPWRAAYVSHVEQGVSHLIFVVFTIDDSQNDEISQDFPAVAIIHLLAILHILVCIMQDKNTNPENMTNVKPVVVQHWPALVRNLADIPGSLGEVLHQQFQFDESSTFVMCIVFIFPFSIMAWLSAAEHFWTRYVPK